MRVVALAVVCALPVGGLCLWARSPSQADAPGAGLSRELALFEDVVARTARERAHTAVALAAGPGRLSWGVAVSAPTAAEAKALALFRCRVRARTDRVAASCALYAVDGRALYLDRD